MKKKIIAAAVAALIVAATTILGVFAAKQTEPEQNDGLELTLTQDKPIQDESPNDAVVDDETYAFDISVTYPMPDLHTTLSESTHVIKGEVVEALEPYQANPDGTLVNNDGNMISYSVVTPYMVRVNEVYKGDVKPGDVIVVNALNDFDIPPNAYEIYKEVTTNIPNIYFDVGKEIVLCLEFSDYYYPAGTAEDDVGYMLADRFDAVFEAVPNDGVAAIDADESAELWQSKNFTIDLNTLKDEIKAADDEAAERGAGADSVI